MARSGNDLAAFLVREFPGMRLQPFGYGDWPSLRFELGDAIPVEAALERSVQAATRAVSIYERAVASDDTGFIVFTRWNGGEDDLFFSLLPEAVLPAVDREYRTDFHEQGEEVPHTTYTVAMRLRAFEYARCFSWIANAELGRSPSLDGRVYFVNSSRPLVFHMYDDRGAILIASVRDRLETLRTECRDWLAGDESRA